MKIKFILLFFCLFIFSCSSKNVLVPHFEVTSGISRELKTPGFWISRTQNPDKIILTEKQIENLNAKILANCPFLKNVFSTDPEKEKEKRSRIDYANKLKKYSKYYDAISLKKVGPAFFETLKNNIDPDAPINIRFALTIGYAKLKALPTDVPLISSSDTADINRLAATDLNFWSPVAALYSTKDNQWCYVISEVYEGWIKAKHLIFASKEALSDYFNDKNIAVVTSRFADIYKDTYLSQFYESVKMGTILHISKIKNDTIEVKIPVKSLNENLEFMYCYVKKSDVSLGFLPYTKRNVIVQAFKQIDAPYDWGHNYGYTDCSGFVRQIFSCFGIKFPKNSGQQINIKDSIELGKYNITLKAQTIISEGISGITLLYFPGHIMLYLGHLDKNLYVIHSIRGYSGKNNKIHMLNKVAVTDLALGDKSKDKSLRERITLMNVVK
ncbi:MAG: C40 family peptidase [Endomicrobium sp.]|jgi:hypothetical protein|nr:C40 family peptidase [Endomicrobium sp.]